MKKLIFVSLLFLGTLSSSAQNAVQTSSASAPTSTVAFKFGYFSYKDVLESAPDYAIIRRNIANLRGKYEAEMKRVTDEFNVKYEAFLDGQKDFAPSIREKRQAELQDLMEKNLAFKQDSERLLRQAEEDALAPLRARLAVAIRKVGDAKGLAFILNIDNNTVPYLHPQMGENVSAAISAELK